MEQRVFYIFIDFYGRNLQMFVILCNVCPGVNAIKLFFFVADDEAK